MNTKTLHHQLRFVRMVKLWHLLVLLIFFAGLSAVALRQNNLGMIERRNLVKVADQQNGDVQGALGELQRYVGSHMNTNMGDKGLYLEHTYQRAYNRAVQQAIQQDTVDGGAYLQADRDCKAAYGQSGAFSSYVQCVSDRVGTLQPANEPLSTLKEPSVSLFRHTYESPRWSPDLAGWSLLVAIALALLLVLRIVLAWVLQVLQRAARQ